MELSNSSQTTTLERLRANYDSLMNRTIVQKWKDLRQLYVEYTEKVSILTSQLVDFRLFDIMREDTSIT